MVKVITSGREDLENLWEKSEVFSHTKREQHPFLVFIESEDKIKVLIVKTIDKLLGLNIPKSTRIMVQWEGTWKSDFFHFNFKEIRNAYYEKYPIISNDQMEKYYELYHEQTGKNALRGGSETKIFQQWYHSKRETERRNELLKKK